MVGIDPSETVLRQARERAREAGLTNLEWILGDDSDLANLTPSSVTADPARDDPDLGTGDSTDDGPPLENGDPGATHPGAESDDPTADDPFPRGADPGLALPGPVRLATMGRSFHWMDREATLDRLSSMLEPGGGVAILGDSEWFTRGTEDWQEPVYELAGEYLEDLPARTGPVEEYDDPYDELLERFGFTDVAVATFERERRWTVDEVVGYVFFLSFCSPERFGTERNSFEAELRDRLAALDREAFVETAEVRIVSGYGPERHGR